MKLAIIVVAGLFLAACECKVETKTKIDWASHPNDRIIYGDEGK